MTDDTELEHARARVEGRAQELQRLYVDMQALVREQMDKQRAMDKSELKEVSTKLSEMQTLQLSLLRAEETLYDKLRFKSNEEKSDYSEIRGKIGRVLNRLRATIAAEKLSGPTDGSSG